MRSNRLWAGVDRATGRCGNFQRRCGLVDDTQIRVAVASIIKAIGEDPAREGLVGTPERVASMYAELFMGVDKDPREELTVGFEAGHREMVVLKDIPFYSMCEHHLLPFYGVAHVGYVPGDDGRVVGISKLARVVEIVARRPQLQERMTSQIADAIVDGLDPAGVAVVIQAEHLCMIMRGIEKPGSNVITSALRGLFQRKPASRAEFLSLINTSRG
jgi:GTP cyclohydrolase I